MARKGLFILSYPLLEDKKGLYFGDECYRHTIELCRPFMDEAFIVARKRRFPEISPGYSLINEAQAQLKLELPDFGFGGKAVWRNLFYFLMGKELKKSLRDLIREVDFVYVDAPSPEAWLTALSTRKTGRWLIMEMRGEVLLNRHYMTERFGPRGTVYAWVFQRSLKAIRDQAIAGLYMNQSLQRRYAVRGPYRKVISDVRLPDHLFNGPINGPRKFTSPAKHFLFVGSLEKIKQVDLILKALGGVRDRLPSDWTFRLVGEGPEKLALSALADRLGILSHLSFMGRVEWGEALFTIYRESDLFLMASRSEGASRTLMEAMALGCPVISTKVGTASELLDQRALTKGEGVSEYGQKLISIAENPGLPSTLSAKNWTRVQEYQLSSLRRQREEFYSQAIAMCRQINRTTECEGRSHRRDRRQRFCGTGFSQQVG